MASTSVLKLVIDDKEYNASLKEARTGMQHLENALNSANKTFNQVDKSVVDYVRGIGQMEAQSKTAKGRIGEMTTAFVELSMQYSKMSNEIKSGDVGKALAESMQTLKQRTIDAKQELAELNSQLDTSKSGIPSGGGMGNIGGLLGGKGGGLGGMLQVFGGNLMTKAAGWVASFASEMGEVVQQSVELASQGEGIRNAFERLGRGDLLDGLREATHGTVTDLELMKAAVRFNDFNLPLEELSTMLAFAQQKAKDTGQSVDFLVESIVNGLGRQSTQILDNLGLSQAEVKKRTAETGDMTKAVGQIIREQMAAAGEYIETAADRAAKADVDLKNAMDDLGRTLLPLQEQGVSMWTSLKIGAVELLNEGLKPMVPAVVELKDSMSDMFDTVANSNAFSKLVSWMQESFDWAVRLIPVVNVLRDVMAGIGNKGLAGGASIGGALGNFMSYDAGQLPEVVVKAPRIRGGGGRTGGGRTGRSTVTTPKVDEILPVGSVAALNKELSELRKKQDLATDTAGWMAQQREIDSITTKIKILKGQMPDPSKIQAAGGASVTGESTFTVPKELNLDTGHIDNLVKKAKEMENAYKLAASAVSSIGDAFSSIEDPSAKAAGMVMQAIASIALGFAQASAQPNTAGTGWGWLAWLAAGTAALATTISTVHSLTNLSEGGFVPGNSYSGDNIPGNGGTVGLNSGELVLNRSQQNNLANALQGGPQGIDLRAVVSGEQIVLVANRSLKRRGKGELVTWK